jgi:DNA-binding beta-propeller fold protein YncE
MRSVVALLAGLAIAGPAAAAGTGLIFVSNEKSSTISVLTADGELVETIETCARPRGMLFSADRSQFYVGCADDDQIAIYDVASRKLLRRIRDIEEPETFDLHPDGRHLNISNEEDAGGPAIRSDRPRRCHRLA